jgi:hypothetical protein
MTRKEICPYRFDAGDLNRWLEFEFPLISACYRLTSAVAASARSLKTTIQNPQPKGETPSAVVTKVAI